MLTLQSEKQTPIELSLVEGESAIYLTASGFGLMFFDKATHKATAIQNVPHSLGFSVDKNGRLIVE